MLIVCTHSGYNFSTTLCIFSLSGASMLQNKRLDVARSAHSPVCPPSAQATVSTRQSNSGSHTTQIARSWTRSAKLKTTCIVSLYKFISSLASSSPSLALSAIQKDLAIADSVIAILPMSIYLLGYAIGPLIIAPLSDAFGRVCLLQTSNILFNIFNLAAGFATNSTTILLMRFLSGVGGSGPITVRCYTHSIFG
jgi:sugar phosphate permease